MKERLEHEQQNSNLEVKNQINSENIQKPED